MKVEDKYEIRKTFINLTNKRGLLWTDTVEGILFDKNGFLRLDSTDVKIDEDSLVDKLSLNNTTDVINYILVIDYLTDYLKNKYDLSDIEISTLLKDYLTECNIFDFDELNGEIGSWIIPSSLIIKENVEIFENIRVNIILWLNNKWNKKYVYLKEKAYKKDIAKIVVSFIDKKDKLYLKQLLSIQGRNDKKLWNKFNQELVLFINEKKNSPTSS